MLSSPPTQSHISVKHRLEHEHEFEQDQKGAKLTVMAGVEEMFSKVTAEHPLPEDTSLLQLLLGRPGLHECAQKSDQFPVFLGH